MKKIKINNFQINEQLNPYIIAEIGVNHEGSIDLAKKLVRLASDGGANAVKFQSYKAETLASKNSPAYWDLSEEPTKSQFELFKKFDFFNNNDYLELADYCKSLNIDFLSTPFDLKVADFLSDLVPAFKIASADITNYPLLRKCAGYKKPIILSVGASSLIEIKNAVSLIESCKNNKIIILHCVLNYPTALDKANLHSIKILKQNFKDYYIGYSDHVPPRSNRMAAMEMATILGAVVLEKHFTHNKKLQGNDHYHAMDKIDLINFKKSTEDFNMLAGTEKINIAGQENARIYARRSIYSSGKIKKGQIITNESIIAKRPGEGISPIYWDQVIGRKMLVTIEDDTKIDWEMLSK